MADDNATGDEEIAPIVLAEFPRGEGEKLVLAEKTFKGHRFVDARIHSMFENQSHPTKRGVSFKLRDLPAIIAALSKVSTEQATPAPAATTTPAPAAPSKPMPAPQTLPLPLGQRPAQHRMSSAAEFMSRPRGR